MWVQMMNDMLMMITMMALMLVIMIAAKVTMIVMMMVIVIFMMIMIMTGQYPDQNPRWGLGGGGSTFFINIFVTTFCSICFCKSVNLRGAIASPLPPPPGGYGPE